MYIVHARPNGHLGVSAGFSQDPSLLRGWLRSKPKKNSPDPRDGYSGIGASGWENHSKTIEKWCFHGKNNRNTTGKWWFHGI